MSTLPKTPRNRNPKPVTEETIMNIREILQEATAADKAALKDFLAEETKKEGWGKKTVRYGLPVIGTVIVAGATTYLMTRGLKRDIKETRTELGNLRALINEGGDNVVPMAKTGTR